MNRKLFGVLVILALGWALAGCVVVQQTAAPAGAPVAAETMTPLKIGYSVWVGYGPLFIAQEKGYFKEEGLAVELVKVEDPKARFAALAGQQLDGLVSTLDTATQYWKPETPFKAVLGLDESSGGDGIVGTADLNSVADLKGKQIGVNVGSVSQFFLEYMLQQNGMSTEDVTLVKMQQGDVPAALASNNIDAGVTWEPHLSKAVSTGGKLIASSKETPGLIVDILILRNDILESNDQAAKGLVNAWHKAVEFAKTNPDEAATIMATGLGGFYETADDIKADLAGVTLFDAARNQAFFTGAGQGTATGTLQFAIDFYTQIGVITDQLKTEDMLDSSYVQ
jgi:NitT/TauT family transport system substrate-binding protein